MKRGEVRKEIFSILELGLKPTTQRTKPCSATCAAGLTTRPSAALSSYILVNSFPCRIVAGPSLEAQPKKFVFSAFLPFPLLFFNQTRSSTNLSFI